MNTTQTPDDTIYGWTMDFSIPGLSLNSPPTPTSPAEIHTDPSIETPPSISAQSQVTLPSVIRPPSPVHQPESTPGPGEAVGSTVHTTPADNPNDPDLVAPESSAATVSRRTETTRSAELSMTTVVSPWVRDPPRDPLSDPTYRFPGVPRVTAEQNVLQKANNQLFPHHCSDAHRSAAHSSHIMPSRNRRRVRSLRSQPRTTNMGTYISRTPRGCRMGPRHFSPPKTSSSQPQSDLVFPLREHV